MPLDEDDLEESEDTLKGGQDSPDAPQSGDDSLNGTGPDQSYGGFHRDENLSGNDFVGDEDGVSALDELLDELTPPEAPAPQPEAIPEPVPEPVYEPEPEPEPDSRQEPPELELADVSWKVDMGDDSLDGGDQEAPLTFEQELEILFDDDAPQTDGEAQEGVGSVLENTVAGDEGDVDSSLRDDTGNGLADLARDAAERSMNDPSGHLGIEQDIAAALDDGDRGPIGFDETPLDEGPYGKTYYGNVIVHGEGDNLESNFLNLLNDINNGKFELNGDEEITVGDSTFNVLDILGVIEDRDFETDPEITVSHFFAIKGIGDYALMLEQAKPIEQEVGNRPIHREASVEPVSFSTPHIKGSDQTLDGIAKRYTVDQSRFTNDLTKPEMIRAIFEDSPKNVYTYILEHFQNNEEPSIKHLINGQRRKAQSIIAKSMLDACKHIIDEHRALFLSEEDGREGVLVDEKTRSEAIKEAIRIAREELSLTVQFPDRDDIKLIENSIFEAEQISDNPDYEKTLASIFKKAKVDYQSANLSQKDKNTIMQLYRTDDKKFGVFGHAKRRAARYVKNQFGETAHTENVQLRDDLSLDELVEDRTPHGEKLQELSEIQGIRRDYKAVDEQAEYLPSQEEMNVMGNIQQVLNSYDTIPRVNTNKKTRKQGEKKFTEDYNRIIEQTNIGYVANEFTKEDRENIIAFYDSLGWLQIGRKTKKTAKFVEEFVKIKKQKEDMLKEEGTLDAFLGNEVELLKQYGLLPSNEALASQQHQTQRTAPKQGTPKINNGLIWGGLGLAGLALTAGIIGGTYFGSKAKGNIVNIENCDKTFQTNKGMIENGLPAQLQKALDDAEIEYRDSIASVNRNSSWEGRRASSLREIDNKREGLQQRVSDLRSKQKTYETHVVEDGENIWSIVEKQKGHGASDQEIARGVEIIAEAFGYAKVFPDSVNDDGTPRKDKTINGRPNANNIKPGMRISGEVLAKVGGGHDYSAEIQGLDRQIAELNQQRQDIEASYSGLQQQKERELRQASGRRTQRVEQAHSYHDKEKVRLERENTRIEETDIPNEQREYQENRDNGKGSMGAGVIAAALGAGIAGVGLYRKRRAKKNNNPNNKGPDNQGPTKPTGTDSGSGAGAAAAGIPAESRGSSGGPQARDDTTVTSKFDTTIDNFYENIESSVRNYSVKAQGKVEIDSIDNFTQNAYDAVKSTPVRATGKIEIENLDNNFLEGAKTVTSGIDMILALYDSGANVKESAREEGNLRDTVVSLYNRGDKVKDIESRLGVNVYHHLNKAGITKRRTSRLSGEELADRRMKASERYSTNLENGRESTVKEMASELGISTSTFYRDINNMKDKFEASKTEVVDTKAIVDFKDAAGISNKAMFEYRPFIVSNLESKQGPKKPSIGQEIYNTAVNNSANATVYAKKADIKEVA